MKKAFTLAEVLIVLMMIGFLAVVMLKSLKLDAMENKQNAAAVLKVIDEFNNALAQIRNLETSSVPAKAFIVDIAGTSDYQFYNKGTSTLATTTDVFNILSDYMRLDKPSTLPVPNFCTYTGWSSCPLDAIGARFSGNIYIGLEVSTGLIDCPQHYIINTDKSSQETSDGTRAGSGKCWAELYIDTNGKKGPNEAGKDVFVFGLDAIGVQY